MTDSLLKVLRIIAVLVSIACFALFFFKLGYEQGYYDGRLSIQPRIDTLINYQKEVESLFRQMELRCDSIEEFTKEGKK